MTRSGRLYDLITNAKPKLVTVRGTICMARSVTKLSSRTSNIRLPVQACAHATIEDVRTELFLRQFCQARSRMVISYHRSIVQESTQLSNSMMSLKHIFAGVLD